jgi:hypothetical protein
MGGEIEESVELLDELMRIGSLGSFFMVATVLAARRSGTTAALNVTGS